MRKSSKIALQVLLLCALSCLFCSPITAQPGQSMVTVVTQTGMRHYNSGNYREALRLFLQAKDMTVQTKVTDLEMANLLAGLAETQRSMGQFAESEANFKQALAMLDKLPQAKDLLPLYNDLAWLYMDEGRYAEAEAMWKKAESDSQTDENMRRMEYLPINNLARLYFAWGKLGEGSQYLQKALVLAQLPQNKTTLAVPFATYNAATLLALKGQYKDAET